VPGRGVTWGCQTGSFGVAAVLQHFDEIVEVIEGLHSDPLLIPSMEQYVLISPDSQVLFQRIGSLPRTKTLGAIL